MAARGLFARIRRICDTDGEVGVGVILTCWFGRGRVQGLGHSGIGFRVSFSNDVTASSLYLCRCAFRVEA